MSRKKPVVENAEDVDDGKDVDTEPTDTVNTTNPVDAPPVEECKVDKPKVQMLKHEPALSSKVNKKVSVEAIIRSINGRELTLCNCCEDDKCDDVTVQLAKKPEVFLNGEKTTVAGLDNGDSVCLSNGSKDSATLEFEYKRVDATREAK